eukprot:2476886-Pyramimonas_sp.AAC.1
MAWPPIQYHQRCVSTGGGMSGSMARGSRARVKKRSLTSELTAMVSRCISRTDDVGPLAGHTFCIVANPNSPSCEADAGTIEHQ